MKAKESSRDKAVSNKCVAAADGVRSSRPQCTTGVGTLHEAVLFVCEHGTVRSLLAKVLSPR